MHLVMHYFAVEPAVAVVVFADMHNHRNYNYCCIAVE